MYVCYALIEKVRTVGAGAGEGAGAGGVRGVEAALACRDHPAEGVLAMLSVLKH